MAANPYSLVFGQPPLEVVERTSQAERIVSEFCQSQPSNTVNLVTGIHGCGKTGFITRIAGRLKTKKEWIVVNLNPQRDLLAALAAKLCSDKTLAKWFQETGINLQAFGLGTGIKGAPPILDIEEALIRMLRCIRKHRKRVLITVDEVTNSRDIRAFAGAYQLFLREQLPVFLLMSGLPHQIDRLRNADGMTFLERASRTVLNPLNFTPMVIRFTETLRVSQEAATRLAKASRGYPFAFQVIGYFCWEYPDQPEKALDYSRDYLYEFAYHRIWSELSPKDREVLYAVARSKNGEISRIREILEYTSNQFNPYRDRLIKAGVLSAPKSGVVEFALPWFDLFTLDKENEMA